MYHPNLISGFDIPICSFIFNNKMFYLFVILQYTGILKEVNQETLSPR